jgi:hypothetical protein
MSDIEQLGKIRPVYKSGKFMEPMRSKAVSRKIAGKSLFAVLLGSTSQIGNPCNIRRFRLCILLGNNHDAHSYHPSKLVAPPV